MTRTDTYYLGLQLGDKPAASIVRVHTTGSHGSVLWAVASSSVVGDIPHDAISQCLDRLGAPQVAVSAISVIRSGGAAAEQALERVAGVYSCPTLTCEQLAALAARAAFRAGNEPRAVVVADAGILMGMIEHQGLRVDLCLKGPNADSASESAAAEPAGIGPGPWPLVAALAGARSGSFRRSTSTEQEASSRLPRDLPCTQQGLKLGYGALLDQLRATIAEGHPAQLLAARAWVEQLVARDLAALEKTARLRYPGAEVIRIGRLVASSEARGATFEEQAALGAAVLAVWSDVGTHLCEVREAESAAPADRRGRTEGGGRGCVATSVGGRTARGHEQQLRSIESFTDLFSDRQKRDAFLEQCWGRASAHLPALIVPRAMFSGDEFLGAIRRAHAANPNPPPNANGTALVTVIKNGRILMPPAGDRPYPRAWNGQLGSSWSAAHDVLSATERSGCEAWDSSIRLSSAHHVCPALTPLVLSFFEFFESHCWVNAYYSPAKGVPGLSPHTDGTDVFIFQIEGEKHWCFDEGPRPHSVQREEHLSRVRSGTAPLEQSCVLTPGDLLYLPAGTCHFARATTSPSLHLTFAVRRHTALRVRQWYARRAAAASELNRGVQQYDAERGRVQMQEALMRSVVGSFGGSSATPDLLSAYCRENLALDRQATLEGRMAPNVDHV